MRRRDPRREYSRRLALLPEDKRRRIIIGEDLVTALGLYLWADTLASDQHRRAMRAAKKWHEARALLADVGALVDALAVKAAREEDIESARNSIAQTVYRTRLNEAFSRQYWPTQTRSQPEKNRKTPPWQPSSTYGSKARTRF